MELVKNKKVGKKTGRKATLVPIREDIGEVLKEESSRKTKKDLSTSLS